MRNLRCVSLVLVGLAVLLVIAEPALAAKRAYKARISGSNSVSGSALLGTSPNGSSWDFQAFARNVNNSVTEIWIVDTNGSNAMALCGVPGAAESSCTHDGSGNLDIQGTITSGVMAFFGWSGANFRDALDNDRAEIRVYNTSGLIGAGIFGRIFP